MKNWQALILFLPVMMLVGCRDDGLTGVHGTVTFEGKPVHTGTITFYPEKGRPSSGKLDAEGHYELSSYKTGDGIKPGSYSVLVDAAELEGNSESANAKIRRLVPEIYSDLSTTTLTAKITDAKVQKVDFDIAK